MSGGSTLGAMQDFPLRIMRLMDHAEREHGDREIVAARPDGTTIRTNWIQLAEVARRMAQALERLGVKPGERVATLAMNHDRHLAAWFGVVGMGGVLHTLNPRLFDDQLTYIIGHAEDRVILYDGTFEAMVERLKPQLPSVLRWIRFDDEFDEWVAAEDGNYRWYEGDEREPCGLCYTSGTTGNPKGVLYEHRSTVLHAMSIIAPDVFDLSACSVLLPVVPMFHANSWCLPYAAAITGLKLVVCGETRAERICELFNAEGVTHSAGVPTVWLMIIDHAEDTGAKLGKLHTIIVGGSSAPPATIRWFRERGIRVRHLWGMTEMTPIGTVGAPPANWDSMNDQEQLDYVSRPGRSLFGVELRIVDDNGKVLPRDGQSSGHLQTRGASVVRRYFKKDEDCVDADSWFDTGDIAVIHPDNTLRLTDRAKDVIKSGGEWISSIELENQAVGCPGVLEAAAIGIPHPKWDERPLLLVVRDNGSEVRDADIREYLSSRVAKWWLPDAIEFVDELPHTATGKLSKKDLRDKYRDYRFSDAEAMVGRD
ncbi:long-chain fatty acid--CoA ligase [Sphingomonas hankyongi]|uniref:Long-chain fatty acid--CoA ligase n=1 Tax=Sphingomonas hankyongi TaxID=2908209 RepID=A0ABT0S4H4_9SPHN|nr:long-chain fatty acid--CoA ligase [Sphingomonas hankyongi]MCL6730460.1 long-chain fatty acid--CoA ligase [Sphingomonas hankyongi]